MRRRHRFFLTAICLALLVDVIPAGAFEVEHKSDISEKSPIGQLTTPTTIARPADPAAVVNGPPAPIRLTIKDAILTALENNRGLTVERIGPNIRRTYAQAAQAQFDPVIDAQVSTGRERSDQPVRTGVADKRIDDALQGM